MLTVLQNCQKEGHRAAECEAARMIDLSDVPDMTEAEVMTMFKRAAADRDTDLFKQVSLRITSVQ